MFSKQGYENLSFQTERSTRPHVMMPSTVSSSCNQVLSKSTRLGFSDITQQSVGLLTHTQTALCPGSATAARIKVVITKDDDRNILHDKVLVGLTKLNTHYAELLNIGNKSQKNN